MLFTFYLHIRPTIIPHSRLPRTELLYTDNGELAIYNGANSGDGFLTPAIAYCIVLYNNIYCLLPYDSPPVCIRVLSVKYHMLKQLDS